MAKQIFTQNLSEPLDGATTAKFEINPGDGNLMIDKINSSEQDLANGMLEYLEKQDLPVRTSNKINGQTIFKLKAGGTGRQPWFRLPWAACNGATEWQIHLNPTVKSDITAHSDGGNVKLNLAGMSITGVMADTGGGNVDVILPDNSANLSVTARTGAGNVTVDVGENIKANNTIKAESGAGNVTVLVPVGIAVRLDVTSGMGKVILDSQYSQFDNNIYQSPNYEAAADKIVITAKSGAGNVRVNTK